jgi:hypothetical protein
VEAADDEVRGGTALIVVPGVGDDAAGDTVRAMTRALLIALGEGSHATPFTQTIVVAPVPGSAGDPVVHEVAGARVHRAGADEALVVYEMHWADLSRFPGTLRRFVLTLYGMLFQISTIGLEALRGECARTRPQRAILEAFSYLTSVLALGLTAGAAILGVEFAALLRLTGHGWQLAIATLALLLAAVLAWYGDRFLRARGWRFSGVPHGLGRPGLAFGVIALGVGVGPLLIHAGGRSMALSVHDVLWSYGVRWLLPLTWALIGLSALAICAVMALVGHEGTKARDRHAATRTAVLSVVIGGLGIALLGGLLVGAALAVTSRATGAGTPVPGAAAADVGAAQAQFADYSLAVFEQSLRPLGAALICALSLILAIVIMGFPYVSALAQARQGAALPPRPIWAIVAGVVAVSQIPPLVHADSGRADALAVGLAVLAAALAAAYWARRFRPGTGQAPIRRGFDLLLSYLAGATHVVLLVVALALAALALTLATPLTPPASDLLGDLSHGLFRSLAGVASGTSSSGFTASATVAVVVALAAFLASKLPLLARGLDVAYDVATYMRIPHGSPSDAAPVEPPRRQILRRYAALLGHVQEVQAPTRIVIAAHSQGSMYSLALLFGDPFRDSADRVEATSWPLPPRLLPDHPEAIREPAPELTAPLALITAGCPIRQTYAPSFPGQYDWPADTAAVCSMLAGVAPGTTWRNVYRSGDYLGRALWSERVCDPTAPPPPLEEFCLGPGHHTGYWRDPLFARRVLELV